MSASRKQGGSRMDRRGFLKKAGLLGSGIAGMSVLAACGGGAAPSAAPSGSGGAAANADKATTIKLSKPADGTGGGKQLIFRGWNYHPEVVVDNTRIFNEQYQE